MALEYITQTPDGNLALGNYSLGVIAEKNAEPFHISGALGIDAEGVFADGVAGQTTQALTNIRSILEARGLGLDRIAALSIKLSDVAFFGEFDEAMGAFFGKGPFPARETFGGVVPKGGLVEITTIAYLPPRTFKSIALAGIPRFRSLLTNVR